MSRRAFGLGIGLLALFPCPALAGSPTKPTLVRDSKDPRWVHGTITVGASPDRVFSRVERVDKWPTLLSDVKWVKVLEHEGSHWHVRLETRTMDCGAHDYHINVEAKRRLKFVIDATGIDANGVISVGRGKDDAESLASFSLFIQTTGVFGWFIPDKLVRKRQESMVRRDLEDLAKAFT